MTKILFGKVELLVPLGTERKNECVLGMLTAIMLTEVSRMRLGPLKRSKNVQTLWTAVHFGTPSSLSHLRRAVPGQVVGTKSTQC